jgi:hypothetical protein
VILQGKSFVLNQEDLEINKKKGRAELRCCDKVREGHRTGWM